MLRPQESAACLSFRADVAIVRDDKKPLLLGPSGNTMGLPEETLGASVPMLDILQGSAEVMICGMKYCVQLL